jgi:hypothetical protein
LATGRTLHGAAESGWMSKRIVQRAAGSDGRCTSRDGRCAVRIEWSGEPRAVIASGEVDVQDIFEFLAAFVSGGPA